MVHLSESEEGGGHRHDGGGGSLSPVHEAEQQDRGDEHGGAHAQAHLGRYGEGRQGRLGLVLDGAQGQAHVAHLNLARGGGQGS